MRLLLISNSTLHGSGYLDHAESEIRDFLGDAKRVLFVPYALHDRDKYAAQARARFAKMGYELDSIHTLEQEAGSTRQTAEDRRQAAESGRQKAEGRTRKAEGSRDATPAAFRG